MGLLIAKSLALLVVAIVVAIAARRLLLPYTVGLIVAGMTLAFSHVDLGIPLTHDVIFDLMLPPLLFEAALNLDWRELRRDFGPILLLSIAGVLISAAIVTGGIVLLLHWPMVPALTFGVLIAATDPVAVIALFKDLNIQGRLRLMVESESLFNDGVAAVLFALVLTVIASGTAASGSLPWYLPFSMSGGGVLVGIFVALGGLLVAGRTGDHLVETAVTVAVAYGAFLLAEHLNMSGVLATVSAGLVFGTTGLHAGALRLGLSRQGRIFAIAFWEFLAFIANSLVFLLIGISVSHVSFAEFGYGALGAIIMLVLVARALTVYPLSAVFRRSRWAIAIRDQHILFWAGLRGALALALALSLPESLPKHDAVIVSVFAVVTFSIIIQGLTMPALLRLLKTGSETSL